jgi:hypothetical protein
MNMKAIVAGIAGAIVLAGCNHEVPPDRQAAVQQGKNDDGAGRTHAPAPLNNPGLLQGGATPTPSNSTNPDGRMHAPAPLSNPNLMRGG